MAYCSNCGGWDREQLGSGHKRECPKGKAGTPISAQQDSYPAWFQQTPEPEPEPAVKPKPIGFITFATLGEWKQWAASKPQSLENGKRYGFYSLRSHRDSADHGLYYLDEQGKKVLITEISSDPVPGGWRWGDLIYQGVVDKYSGKAPPAPPDDQSKQE